MTGGLLTAGYKIILWPAVFYIYYTKTYRNDKISLQEAEMAGKE